jgi:phage tail-like protein
MRSEEIRRLLPAVFQWAVVPGSPMAALLDAMETLHRPTEARLATLDEILDPRRAPEPFVRMLAEWVNLDLEVTTGVDRLRALVASAVALSRWRGSARGLLGFLEAATGTTGFEIDEDVREGGQIRPFHIRVSAPAPLRDHEDMIERIIRLEKPAYVTHELQFRAH